MILFSSFSPRLRNFPTFTLVFLGICTLVIFIPLVCFRLQFSPCFVQENPNYMASLARNRDEKRVARAETYLAEGGRVAPFPYRYPRFGPARKRGLGPKVRVVVMAVNRAKRSIDAYSPKYLLQTVHALLESLDRDQKKFGSRWGAVNISVCNVDPSKVPFDDVLRVGELIPVDVPQSPELSGNFGRPSRCGGLPELSFCLSLAVSDTAADFVLLLPDDMLAAPDLWAELWSFLGDGWSWGRSVAFLELHTILSNHAFTLSELQSTLEVLLITTSLTTLLFLLFVRRLWRRFQPGHNLLLLLSIFLFCGLLVLLIGRPHWLRAYQKVTGRHVLRELTSPSLSTGLIPSGRAAELAKALADHGCQGPLSKTRALRGFLELTKAQAWTVKPSLFAHIGLYSEFTKDTIDPYMLDA